MFFGNNFSIKEISAVTLVRPKTGEGRIIHYGKRVPRYELIYKLSSEVLTHFHHNVYHIGPGAVYLLPKTEQADYFIERTVPGDCIDIFFDTDAPVGEDLLLLDFSEDSKVKSLFQKIYRLWETKPSGYYFQCMAAMYEILYEITVRSEQYAPKSKYNMLEKGIAYLHRHLYTRIDYKMPSALCGISYTYFKKLFIERFGVPPVQYVNDLRLERGCELLLTGQYSIGEIAKMCGFESMYYFSKRFKQKYQLSPTAYQNSGL